ncbi:hypothetical protein AGRA3207_006776 [Actinomadura graeca]|uniref:DUF485 domain-containing protein n=1 Tax=Actinomadura graeca TaxID=2750812 RepID=A0ABX8R8H4_9ACTN|nr:hypothetical protein [Actinomadura graeca]QXJ25298.1 hypothetical protein AGRA3207_006776 [Actinomadura graeca]
MTDERRAAVSGPSARARVLRAQAAAPAPAPDTAPDTGPSASGSDPAGGEPSGTDPPDPAGPSRPVPPGGSDGPGGGWHGTGPAQARALIRTQLRTALTTGAAVLAVVTGLPALLALAPALGRLRMCGVPVVWLVLAFGVQPLWAAASVLHLRRAERAERDLTGPAGPS